MNFDIGIGKGKPGANFSPVNSFPTYDKNVLVTKMIKWPWWMMLKWCLPLFSG